MLLQRIRGIHLIVAVSATAMWILFMFHFARIERCVGAVVGTSPRTELALKCTDRRSLEAAAATCHCRIGLSPTVVRPCFSISALQRNRQTPLTMLRLKAGYLCRNYPQVERRPRRTCQDCECNKRLKPRQCSVVVAVVVAEPFVFIVPILVLFVEIFFLLLLLVLFLIVFRDFHGCSCRCRCNLARRRTCTQTTT